MNKMSIKVVLAFVAVVAVVSMAEAHKRYYGGPQYEGPQQERCVCDCAGLQRQPILPNKPYYGNAGYAQQPPRQQGYGNAGSYAVSGSYGAGGGQVNGGY